MESPTLFEGSALACVIGLFVYFVTVDRPRLVKQFTETAEKQLTAFRDELKRQRETHELAIKTIHEDFKELTKVITQVFQEGIHK